ncbi:MAG: non-canonical purine NTP diphosphatase [Flavobacteriales bacterium]|nr:non-canonical purine NTP diphosphatase [Flavobacteriales bacterium]
MKLVFATNNKNKIKEIQIALKGKVEVLSLKDIGFEGEIPEDYETLEENALQKAHFIADKFHVNCFADDTGLEIEALNGAPGVYSARYAGEDCIAENNMSKVLSNLKDKETRTAQFRTVVALILNEEEFTFEGVVNGEILNEKSGKDGFGYDPIFQPDGFNVSFAEMSMEQKNEISHRGKAVRKLVDFLSIDQ